MDSALGHIHCGSNAQLYHKLLIEFTHDQHNVVYCRQDALKKNNIKAAERTAHFIKGPSATIGCESVSRLVFNIESSFRHSDIKRAEQLLDEAIATLCESIAEHYNKLDQDSEQTTSTHKVDQKTLMNSLQELTVLLKRGCSHSEAQLDICREYSNGYEQLTELDALQERSKM
ncbi:MAG: hypothetical protein GY694_16085 [Gammaproteobacteria bacterium]|nr:hypothetical protein [Gammaproteobacteria bacterium]